MDRFGTKAFVLIPNPLYLKTYLSQKKCRSKILAKHPSNSQAKCFSGGLLKFPFPSAFIKARNAN
jgi:hypothetical protein